MKTNERRQICTRCGEYAEPGTGTLSTRERPDGGREWVVTHTDPCEPRRTNRAQAASSSEVPRWAVYCEGRTPEGNKARGVAFVDGEPPDHDALPMNDAANAIARDWPSPVLREHDVCRAEILARFGHTEETFRELGILRLAYRKLVPAARRYAMATPLAADLPDVLAKEGVTAEQIEKLRSST